MSGKNHQQLKAEGAEMDSVCYKMKENLKENIIRKFGK
jgi:hypothetical protein